MKVSSAWLDSFFKNPPSVDEITDALTFHAFEIESREKVGADTVLDVKVLPDRAHDALSHRGIAKEISVILKTPLINDPLFQDSAIPAVGAYDDVEITIDDSAFCRRYSAIVMRNVRVGSSPKWLSQRLEAIGQRSINNVVDITNYVMFHIGQPLHAFDMDKLIGEPRKAIRVRQAKEGEKMTGLDGVTYELSPEMLLITDGFADVPIGIAGIKGGKASEITEDTKNILIESANFDPVSVRKTSQRLKLRTDASVRFENEISPELTIYGLQMAEQLIREIAEGKLEGLYDSYPETREEVEIKISTPEVNVLLGSSISGDEIESIFRRFQFASIREGEEFTVVPPFERLDLRIPEDLIEEIGRIYGYDNIAPATPSASKPPRVNKNFYYAEKMRDILVNEGFSEVYTSSFRAKDDVKLANALASDKGYLRSNLSENLNDALEMNLRNAPLLGVDVIKIFEIGTVFLQDGEYISLALGARGGKKFNADEEVQSAYKKIEGGLGISNHAKVNGGIMEINFTDAVSNLSNPDTYEEVEKPQDIKYKPISSYPFVLRDIALFVPRITNPGDVEKIIKKEAGHLLVRVKLFDTYQKEDKISYAFSLVFQSYEKTLSDEEVNAIMEKIYAQAKENGWQVR